jgi:hypothetical protein
MMSAKTPRARRPRRWGRIKAFWLVVASVISAILAVLTFPKKVIEASDVSSQTWASIQRPLVALWYGHIGNLTGKAGRLVTELHPGSDVCVVKSALADLKRDGWEADLVIVYAQKPADKSFGCGTHPDAPRPLLAVFTPSGFSFRYAGTAGASDDPPSEWTTRDGFLFRKWEGTDFPSLDVWYLYSGALNNSGTNLKLTDDSEHEYDLRTKKYEDGVIGWGTPEGLFYMEVSPEGKFVKANGLPKALFRPDSSAVDLRWLGTSFADSSGKELSSDQFKDFKLQVTPLSHLYVSGCEPVQGFMSSQYFPGAVVPIFNQSPQLRCSGSNEDEFTDITVERAQ